MENKREDILWHSFSDEKLETELSTSIEKGLTDEESNNRIKEYGENSFVKEDKFRLLKLFFKNFHNLLIYVLFGAALISYFSGEIIEFYVILLIIALTIFLSFFQQFSADRIVKALNNLKPASVTVLRDGKKISLLPEKLVPGDIVLLQRGDVVPADMRIVESSGLGVDEATLTGESVSKSKSEHIISKADVDIPDKFNCVFASTSVTGGSGKGVVYATGFDTEIGKLSESIQSAKDTKSPLQKKVDSMSRQISIIVLILATLIFSLLLLNDVSLGMALFTAGVIVVAGIPESFPLALTLALSKGVKMMAKKNALLKNLNSVETLGNTTVICTDKTGTLTQNKMKISRIHFSTDKNYYVDGEAYVPDYRVYTNEGTTQLENGEETINKKDVPNTELNKHKYFFLSSILCNDSYLKKKNGKWQLDGEPTEGAFISLSQSLGYDEIECRELYEKLYEVPFSPEKKYMITLHHKKRGKDYLASIKGAAERVLDKCSHYRDSNGKSVPLHSQKKDEFRNLIEKDTADGFRVMAVASKHMHGNSKEEMIEHLENHYTLEGVVSIEDPIRDEVYSSVETCANAGIKTVMITGDHKLTASAIARELGIVSASSDIVITGDELQEMDDKQLDSIISRIKVFSRVSPEDKFRIIQSFQRKGEIVAMTGDGVNDAPALKEADIGVSMGQNGTEVAREASDMILLDDNFSTIVSAVEEGRTIYSNIRRFVYYLLTMNFALVGTILLSIFLGFGEKLPLTALMILFINIVSSTFPALALSVEPTHSNIMQFKPRNPKEKLLSRYILTKIFVVSPIVMMIGILVFLWEIQVGSSYEKAMTMLFLTIVFMGVFHTFNAKKLHTTTFARDFFSNPYLFMSMGFSLSLTLLVVTTSLGRELFDIVPINLIDWLIIIGLSSLVIVFTEMLKLAIKVEFQEQSAMRGIKYPFG